MEQSPLDLREFLTLLWRRKWIVVIVAVTSVGAALAYSFTREPLFTSASEVVVRAARFDPQQPSVATSFVNMTTEERVANSGTVWNLARKDLGGLGEAPLTVEAVQVPEAEALQFVATSADPVLAQAAAQAHAEAYLEHRRQTVLTDLRAAREPLQVRIQEIDQELVRLAEEIQLSNDESEKARLSTQWQSLYSEKSLLIQDSNRFISPDAVQVGEVIRHAQLPLAPSSPNHTRNGLVGIVVGLSLGIGFAYLRDRFDERVRDPEEVEVHAGAPVLAGIPPGNPLKNTLPIAVSDPASEMGEAYHALRIRILRAAEDLGVSVLVVTSSMAQEGKTSVVANLGAALADSGKRVALISADLRRPGLQEFFPAENGAGLSQVLIGKRNLGEVISGTRVKNLSIVHAGGVAGSLSVLDLLSSEAMKRTVRELRRSADFVLIDTTPLLAAFDAAAVAAFADGVLYVADARLVSRTTLEQARRELEISETPLLGIIVNRYKPSHFRPYRYPQRGDSLVSRKPGVSISWAARRLGEGQSNGESANRETIPPVSEPREQPRD